MSTLKYINSGTYGCVVTPGITSDNNIDTNINTITKLFVSKESYEEELAVYDNIDRIVNDADKLRIFTAIKMGNSILTKEDKSRLLNDEIYKNCNSLKDSSDDKSGDSHDSDYKIDPNIYQIEYFNGGINVYDLFHVKDLDKKIDINLLLNNFLNVFEFVNLINSKGYVHADIKLQNIVFDIETHIFRLIDFGLTVSEDEIYHYKNMVFLKEGDLFPPEYIFTAYFAEKQDIDSYQYFFFNRDFKRLQDRIKSKYFKNIFIQFYNKVLKKYKNNTNTISDIIKLFSNVKTLENQEQISEYINKVCNTTADTNINIKAKIDVYQLGTAFLFLLLHIFSSNINTSELNFNIIPLMLNLIFKMIQPNPCNRITMNDAFIEYQIILSQPHSLISLNKFKWYNIIDFNMFFNNLSSIFEFYKTNSTKNIKLKNISYNIYNNSFVFSVSSESEPIPKFNIIDFDNFDQYDIILDKFKYDDEMSDVLEEYKEKYNDKYGSFDSNIEVNNVFLIGNVLFSILLNFLQYNYSTFNSDKIKSLIKLINLMINPNEEKRISFDDAYKKYKKIFV
jgi:serine/threonine protein kinase